MKTRATRARCAAAMLRDRHAPPASACACVLTDMDAPIGRTIGNALEIAESIEVLRGGGPADTRELTVVLGGEMLALAGAATIAEARPGRDRATRSTTAAPSPCSAGSSRPRAATPASSTSPAGCRARRRPPRVLARPRAARSPRSTAETLGIAGVWLGAGRRAKEDEVDPAAGLTVEVRRGEAADAGQPLCVLHHPRDFEADRLGQARALVAAAFAVAPDDPATTQRLARRAAASSRSCDDRSPPPPPISTIASTPPPTRSAPRPAAGPRPSASSSARAWAASPRSSRTRPSSTTPTSRTSRARTSSATPGGCGWAGAAARRASRCRAGSTSTRATPRATVAFPARVLIALGARVLIVTNAAGGLVPEWPPGTLMLDPRPPRPAAATTRCAAPTTTGSARASPT